MSSPLDSVLSRALSIRLNLQISLSSLVVVEEWMDVHLNRWLESVPLPPEMPMGHTAHFSVGLAADLSRVSWRAYGNPSGFVPKMAKYFKSCRMSNQDMMLLDQLGEMLEPRLVGTWVSVVGKEVSTGWQFTDSHPFAEVQPMFGEHEAKRRLVAWLDKTGIDKFSRFSQSISDQPFTEIEFAIPGVSIDDQLAGASRAFTALLDEALPEPVIQVMSSALAPEFTLAVRIAGGAISRLSLIAPGFGNDIISELCAAAGTPFDQRMVPKLQGALGAQGADRVEYFRQLSQDQWPTGVDLQLIPTDTGDLPIKGLN